LDNQNAISSPFQALQSTRLR